MLLNLGADKGRGAYDGRGDASGRRRGSAGGESEQTGVTMLIAGHEMGPPGRLFRLPLDGRGWRFLRGVADAGRL